VIRLAGARPAADMADAVILEPVAKLARHIGWRVIARGVRQPTTSSTGPLGNEDLAKAILSVIRRESQTSLRALGES
jgi:hypothetical protein